MIISKKFKFEAGHRLLNHKGLCHNIHGHNYVVEVFISSKGTNFPDKNGMVVDFKELKEVANKRIFDSFDHAMILNNKDVVMYQFCMDNDFKYYLMESEPTAEMMAKLFYEVLEMDCWTVCKVIVWETEDSKAIYEGN